ncbi:MAG: hypothetical protein A2Y04_05060 [Omnitrophica WOR_2 bacterium GWC2_45_7]|nr:MAG: hypothetical protein A2Y04_05060 [Omnitrophica WOR_2 bacterium GWC2_45_7]
MDHDLLIKALEATQKGQSFAFATLIEATGKGTPRKAGAKMIVFNDGTVYGSIGGGRNEMAAQRECLKCIKTGKPSRVTYKYFGKKGQSICGGQIEVFIEPFAGQRHLVICGAGHIALPLSVIGKMLNYKVSVLDDRKEFANKKRFPHVDKTICGEYARELKKIPIDHNTFIMIVTPGNAYDFICLKTVVKTPSSYIGVISSKAKRIKFLNKLKKLDVSADDLRKIHIPAGIDIGAQTPEEIAISISSEIIKINNKFFLGTDKFNEKLSQQNKEGVLNVKDKR